MRVAARETVTQCISTVAFTHTVYAVLRVAILRCAGKALLVFLLAQRNKAQRSMYVCERHLEVNCRYLHGRHIGDYQKDTLVVAVFRSPTEDRVKTKTRFDQFLRSAAWKPIMPYFTGHMGKQAKADA